MRAYDCQPSEINLHIDHSPALGARGWRCVPIIFAQQDRSLEARVSGVVSEETMLSEEGDCFQS